MIMKGANLSTLFPSEASAAIAQDGYLVLQNTGASPEEFAEWFTDFAYTLSPDIWCSDKSHSSLFWRVTNQNIDERTQGLFSSDDVDWHTDLAPIIDSQEVIGLYGKTITFDTETWVCSAVEYWNRLDEETKSMYKELVVELYHASINKDKELFETKWQVDWDKEYPQEIIDGLRKNRQLSQIQNCTNISLDNAKKFNKHRGLVAKYNFVSNHPLGADSIFFHPHLIVDLYKENQSIIQGKEIFQTIYRDLIESNKYTYKHRWKEGDILLIDQINTLHRRTKVYEDKPRELLRCAGWYKNRKHYNYVL
jgi:alpha-ketoglutarate-dependent taurine dioxygenase